jgi:hypothetical protein
MQNRFNGGLGPPFNNFNLCKNEKESYVRTGSGSEKSFKR